MYHIPLALQKKKEKAELKLEVFSSLRQITEKKQYIFIFFLCYHDDITSITKIEDLIANKKRKQSEH